MPCARDVEGRSYSVTASFSHLRENETFDAHFQGILSEQLESIGLTGAPVNRGFQIAASVLTVMLTWINRQPTSVVVCNTVTHSQIISVSHHGQNMTGTCSNGGSHFSEKLPLFHYRVDHPKNATSGRSKSVSELTFKFWIADQIMPQLPLTRT
jgi:hypothetical protein